MAMAGLPAPVVLRPPELLIQAVSDGRRLGLQLYHAAPGMGRVLSDAGAWWSPGRRMWLIEVVEPERCLGWLADVYHGQHVELEGAPALLKAAMAAPQPDYFTQLLDVQVFPLLNGDPSHSHHAVSFSYDVPSVGAMRALRGCFHKPVSAW